MAVELLAALPTWGLALPSLPAHEAVAAGESWWAAWNPDPRVLVPVGLWVACYVRGLARWPQRSRAHPWWRSAFYVAGLVVGVLALLSPLDALASSHFTFHMIQHELLLMVAVPLILLGAPLTPTLRGLPRRLRLGVVRPLARRHAVRGLYRRLTHPLLGVGALTLTLWLWHLAPGWYDAALRRDAIHDLQHASYLLVGGLFWWALIDPAPLHARMSYPVRVAYVLIGGTPKHLLAALLTFAGHALYGAYLEAPRVVALTPDEDQVLGGLLMWVPSQMMSLAVAAALFFLWAQRSERAQQADERGGDGAASTGGSASPGPLERASNR